MKQYYLIKDSFKSRMIVSFLAISILFIFNVWFIYKDQIPLKAALASQTFYIDNQLSADCMNYVVASRTCGASSGIKAWQELKSGLLAIKALQDNSTIELGGHTIFVRSGTYYPNRLTTWPNGANDNKRNTIRGYGSEIPVISGAKILANWQTEGNDVYSSTDLLGTNSYLDVRDIYQDDVQLTEAEYPNNGAYYTIDARGDGTYIEDSELIALYNQNPDLVLDGTVEFLGRELFGERYKIEYVDTQTNRAYFYANNVIGTAPYPNAIYHLVGKKEYMDQAGEFYYQTSLDGKNGEKAYVKFSSGDVPANHFLVVPDQEIFHFGYGSIRPAYYLNLSNFELKHGVHGVYLEGDRLQIVNYGNDFVHHITFDNVDSHDNARFGYILGGNAHHIVVKNSSIENNNLAGIYFVSFYKPICGNGTLENWTIGDEYATNPEQCDDGNLIDGDGCSARCGLSGGYNGLAVEPWDDYYKAHITIDNNVIRNNKSNGIAYAYLANGVISNNILEYNGAHSANSGIGAQRGSDTEIFGNSISYQGGNGILIEGGVGEKSRRYNIYNNTVHYSAYNNDPHISAYFAVWLDEADSINVHDNTFYNENGR
jgi:cysteine-rich repeat protein